MRIAYIGLKGLPGTFSGIETHVHELGKRLVLRGHEVTAYVRPQYTPREIREDAGIRLRHIPTIKSKHLDASVHSFLSAVHSISASYDIVHFHTIGPASFGSLTRLSNAKIVTTIHRMDYLSGKWGWFARSCLQLAERVCLNVSHRTIVVAPFLREHYNALGYDVEYIPNGVPLPSSAIGADELGKLGLRPNEYYLFLGRLVPEKRPEWAIKAFIESCPGHEKLVIAGGSSATDRYVEELKRVAAPAEDRIIFTGAVYGQLKEELLGNARAFLLPSALEGLPITLLEAMSYGRPCLVSDIPPHKDVIVDGRNGFLHDADSFASLSARLGQLPGMDSSHLAEVGAAARRTVAENYDWEDVVDSIEKCYEATLSGAGPSPAVASARDD